MSALPQTFPVPLSSPDERSVVRRKRRTTMALVPPSRAHSGLKTLPQGRENPGLDFASLYQTYRRRVYSQCLRMLRNHTAAEDAAQEVFLQLFRKVHTFRGESRFSTWLHRLTTNCVLMEIRRIRRRAPETPHEAPYGSNDGKADLDPPLDSFPAPSTPIFDRVILGAAVSRLPAGYQRIFQLHDVEGYTHQEIASLLSIQAGTSKSQLHKARLRMRHLLKTSRSDAVNCP